MQSNDFFRHFRHREERLQAKQYDKCAQIVDIVGRGLPSILEVPRLHNFIFRHVAYIDPRDILKRDDATLFFITDSHAAFCVSDFDVYNPKTHPFTFVRQFLQAKQEWM